jgi:DNA-binding FrmR family transcriptional regulator
MKIENADIKDKLIQRLRRIEGQVRGVQGMLTEERDCRDIMQQLTAIHSAVQSTSRTFFQNYAAVCLAAIDEEDQPDSETKREKILEEMIALLDKTP